MIRESNIGKWIGLLGLLMIWVGGKSQLPDYHLQLFDYTSGIQPGTINSVGKDNKGCLWILYRRQVQRFDGKRNETFRPDELVDNMLCDSKGRVWITSDRKSVV